MPWEWTSVPHFPVHAVEYLEYGHSILFHDVMFETIGRNGAADGVRLIKSISPINNQSCFNHIRLSEETA